MFTPLRNGNDDIIISLLPAPFVKGFLIVVVICNGNEVFTETLNVLYFHVKGTSLGGTISPPAVRVLLGRKGVRLMIDAVHVQLLLTYTLVIIGVVALCNRNDK
jgi:hypothetical protein